MPNKNDKLPKDNTVSRSLFVCCVCGKQSKDKYGEKPISYGWDESCMLNSQEFDVSKLVYGPGNNKIRRVIEVKE